MLDNVASQKLFHTVLEALLTRCNAVMIDTDCLKSILKLVSNVLEAEETEESEIPELHLLEVSGCVYQ